MTIASFEYGYVEIPREVVKARRESDRQDRLEQLSKFEKQRATRSKEIQRPKLR